jgi:hypothetical protein
MFAPKVILLFLGLLLLSSLGAQQAGRYDIVICEIMADPSPPVGLPGVEYIEIRNVSATPLPLGGWKLSDASGTATINTAFILQPDSALILCSGSSASSLAVYGRTISVSGFPSLDNDGEELVLRSPQNRVIHAVAYSAEWYGNEVKREGGWSLEMIDPRNPCGGNNWKASQDNSGGTPGRTNSVNAFNPDGEPPRLGRTYTLDSLTAVLVFNEPLDSLSAAAVSNYSVDGLTVNSATPGPLSSAVQLRLAAPLQPGRVYMVSVSRILDCSGNAIGRYNKAKLGLAESPAPRDVIINELLFNPRSGGNDYVEIYNRSNKTIDTRDLYIANRTASGVPGSVRRISEVPFVLFPGDYIAVTEAPEALHLHYLVQDPDAVLRLSALPSFPDDEGHALLLNRNGTIIDEVPYSDKWHFPLIANAEGVSLERLNPDKPSEQPDNWHSAASTAGYGTPAYRNSQYLQPTTAQAMIGLSPKVFSPDNDGHDDLAQIRYTLPEPGFMANIFILDATGRPVRHLARNQLLGLTGSWHWNGLDEKRQKLPVGIYVVLAELFNLKGQKKTFRFSIVLAGRL